MSKKKESKKYEILADELLKYIKDHNLKQNDKLPTIREIIKNSDFSYATVNRTLIEMENKGIISKHQGKGLYVNKIPDELETKNCALVIPSHFSDYKIFMSILTGVRTVLEKSEIGVLVSISNMSHQKEKETIEMLISKQIDGIIIFMEDHYRSDYSHIEELKERNYPFVLIDRYIPEVQTDYVVVNNKAAIFRICSYLKYNRNCETVFFVPDSESPSNITSSVEKAESFTEAMRMLFGVTDNRIITLDYLIENMDKISSDFKSVGISFNHDAMILDLENRLQELGKELPSNFHLFGYNNTLDIPKYPTVEQFNDQVGMKAAEILISKLENPDQETIQYRVEPKLIFPDGEGGFTVEN